MNNIKACVTLCCFILFMGASLIPVMSYEQGKSLSDGKGCSYSGREHEPQAPVEVEAKLVKISPKDTTAEAIIALVSVAEKDLEEVELSCDPPAGVMIDTISGKWEKKIKLHKDIPKSIELEISIAQPGVYDLFFNLKPTNPADPSMATEAYLRINHGVQEIEPEETDHTIEWEGVQVEEGQP